MGAEENVGKKYSKYFNWLNTAFMDFCVFFVTCCTNVGGEKINNGRSWGEKTKNRVQSKALLFVNCKPFFENYKLKLLKIS